MLTQLHIRNFAIIDELELQIGPGMSTLTGETGAGKSIVLDAVELVLGDRASSDCVRAGAERAEIAASFDLAAVPEAVDWLAHRALDDGRDCILRRVIGRDGRSRGFINGQPAPNQSLRELGEMLVDLHGQHEHQSLLRRDVHRRLLDGYAGLGGAAGAVTAAHRRWRRARDELEGAAQQAHERRERGELLRFQIDELDALDLGAEELAELDSEQRRLANVERLAGAARRALDGLYERDSGSAHGAVGGAANELGELAALDPSLGEVAGLLETARIQIEEAAGSLRDYLAACEVDPARLAAIEQRIATVQDLARKHRVDPDALPAHHERLRAELAGLEQAERDATGLQADLDAAAADYLAQAEALSGARREAAGRLGEAVTRELHGLGMAGARFDCRVETRADDRDFGPNGLDRVELLIAANPGQPPRPLAKVASGGELSRISLAIQVVAVGAGLIPTLIFDEVDTGVGGAVAEVVGRKLRRLGSERQVLCVTHLPQVAAQAHHHLQVSKTGAAAGVSAQVRVLQPTERREEIARMLGGLEITQQTRRHAEEMLARAELESAPG